VEETWPLNAVILRGFSLLSEGTLPVRAVFWFKSNMLEPESSKTLILGRLSDMTRMAAPSGHS